MRAGATCLLLVGVAACGDNLPADGFHGGSRLRAVFLTDGDGARQFETFHDPWYGIDCTFRGDPLRCLPEVARVRAAARKAGTKWSARALPGSVW